MKVTSPIPEYELVAPKEAVIAWRHNEVTRQILEIIKAERWNSLRRTVSAEVMGENLEQNVSRAIGYIEGLDFILETLEDVTKFVEDYEDERKAETDTTTVR
jgi:hypothetical protein